MCEARSAGLGERGHLSSVRQLGFDRDGERLVLVALRRRKHAALGHALRVCLPGVEQRVGTYKVALRNGVVNEGELLDERLDDAAVEIP